MKKFNLNAFKTFSFFDKLIILDVWYVKNKVVSYIKDRNNIYKQELVINNDKIEMVYCNCDKSNGGENICMHLEKLKYYVSNNQILELECNTLEQEKLDFKLDLDLIEKKLKEDIRELVDYKDKISHYNAMKLIEIFARYNQYISYYIKKEKYTVALNLIIEYLDILNFYEILNEKVYSEIEEELLNFVNILITQYDYYEKIVNLLKNRFDKVVLSESGLSILYTLIDNIDSDEKKEKLLYLMRKVNLPDYLNREIVEEGILNLSII